MNAASLDAAIKGVVVREACSGCGMCALLDDGIVMELDDKGFMRPARRHEGNADSSAVKDFLESCPGVRVNAGPRPAGSRRHPTMGPYLRAWEAWATAGDLRYVGSSGGALTALHSWLLSTGEVARVVGAAADRSDPRRSVPVTILSREDAIAAAGSRYAPVAVASNRDILLAGTAVTAKPCEIASLRALSGRPNRLAAEEQGGSGALLLSFFCAGTPSSHATDTLIHDLGIPEDTIPDELWYRGRGWPGRFTVRSQARTVDTDYDTSWGTTLGPSTQWRCKVCADGVGESADIVAADFWQTDDHGYPVFIEGDGVSAVIARTERGVQVIERAISAGVLQVRELEMDALARVQPLQRERRETLLGRLVGSRVGGRVPPRFVGFRLIRLSAAPPRVLLQQFAVRIGGYVNRHPDSIPRVRTARRTPRPSVLF